MSSHDDENGFRVRGRSRSKQKDRRPSADVLIRRLAWLDGLLVFSAGECPGHWSPKSTRARIGKALEGKTKGLYIADRHHISLTPVEAPLLTNAEGLMKTSSRAVWSKLSRKVGDPNVWLAERRARLQHIGEVLRTAKDYKRNKPNTDALLIEERCLWIGPDTERPSTHLLAADPSLTTLRDCVKRSRIGCHAAGILLARRQHSVDRDPQWPLDLLCHAGIHRAPYIDFRGGLSEGLQEYLLTCQEQPDANAFIVQAPRVQAALEAYYEEPLRRFTLFRKVAAEIALFHPPYILKRERPPRIGWADGFWNLVTTRLNERYAVAQVFQTDLKNSPALPVDLLFGIEVPHNPSKHLPAEAKPQEPFDPERELATWFGNLLDKLPDPAKLDQQIPNAFLAYAHLASLTGPEQAANIAIRWFDNCRRRIRPSESGHSGLGFAIKTMDQVANPEQAEALHQNGTKVFRTEKDQCWNRKDMDTFWNNSGGYLHYLTRLQAVHEEARPWMLQPDVQYYMRGVLHHKPERFLEAARWCHQHLQGAHEQIGDWTRVFCQLRPASRRVLTDWYADLKAAGYTRRDAGQICMAARCAWYEHGGQRNTTARQRWFEQNPRLFRAIWREAVFVADKPRALDRRFHLFLIASIAWYWEDFGDLPGLISRLVREIMERVEDGVFTIGEQHLDTAVALSCGDPERLVFLLQQSSFFYEGMDRRKAWWHLFKLGGWVLALEMSAYGCESSRLPHLAKLLDDVGYLERLSGVRSVREALSPWMELPASNNEEELTAIRTLMGLEPEHPGIAEVRARPAKLRKEFEALTKRGVAPERRAKLESMLEDRESLEAWMAKDIAKLIAKHLPVARFESLAMLVTQQLEQHGFTRIPGADDKDWENAKLFPASVKSNRRIMKKLLRSLAAGDRHFVRKHPANQRFLRKVAKKGDVKAWLEYTEITLVVGGETWTVYTENDPLKVLQMGNLFGTCLSRTNFNAHSAIANAVEINKRVLYLKDGKGNIIGRKLIVLSNLGEILPFTSYGACDVDSLSQKPWVKIALDLLCLHISRRTGFELVADPDRYEDNEDEMARKHLFVFAEWYFDCCEKFDWWILQLLKAPEIPIEAAAARRGLIDRLERRVSEKKEAEFEHARLLIWLGHDGDGLTLPDATKTFLAETQNDS